MRFSIATLLMIFSGCALAQNAPIEPPSMERTSTAVAHFNKTYPSAPSLMDGFVTVNQVKYHYVTAGEGPMVILYHGFPSFWYAWKFQIAELAKHYKVVAVDGLGSNLSDKPDAINRYHINALADDLNQIALQLGGDHPFHLIGHDWGGTLSWHFAQTYPERLRRLVVLNAPPFPIFKQLLQENERQKKVSRYIRFLSNPWGEALLSFNDSYLIWKMGYQEHVDHNRISHAESALFRQALAQPQALHSAINWYRANLPGNLQQSTTAPMPDKIPVPSLLIWGDKDRTFVPEFIDLLPNSVMQLSVKHFEDAAHWPGLSHSEAVNQEILSFLSSTDAPNSDERTNPIAVIPSLPIPQ